MTDQNKDTDGENGEFEIVDGKLVKNDTGDVDFEDNLTFDD